MSRFEPEPFLGHLKDKVVLLTGTVKEAHQDIADTHSNRRSTWYRRSTGEVLRRKRRQSVLW